MTVFRLERDVYNAQVQPAGPPPIIATSVSVISNLIKLLLINHYMSFWIEKFTIEISNLLT